MKRKMLAAFLAAAMAASWLTACGGNGNSGNVGSEGGSDSKTNVTDSGSSQEADGTGNAQILEQGAGTSVKPNTEKSDETLTVVLGGEPASLLVESTAGAMSTPIRMLIGDRLLDYDEETGEFTGELLESWEIVDEHHLRGFVRKGVKAFDGTEFNAHDIIYSLETAAELSPIFLASSLNVENCVAEDDYTVLFETTGTVTSTMGMMATGVNSMLDESSMEACGGIDGARTNPCWGVGKYKFVEWVPGQYVLLERNEDYWDDSYVGYYKNIKFTFVSDTATRIMSVLSGTADVAPDVALGSVIEYMDSDECDILTVEAGNASGLWVNCANDGPLSNLKVREAVRYAIDADALNMISTSGYAPREDFYILSSSKYYFDPTGGEGQVYDPEKAKSLLEEAGYGDGFELTLLGGTADEEILTAVQGMLSAVGITAHIEMPETSVMTSMGENGEYDLYFSAHSAALNYRTIDVFNSIEPESSAVGKYQGGPKLTDPALQELIDTAVEDLDEETAAKAVDDIVQYVWDNVCYIGVEGSLKAFVVEKGLTGARLDAGACVDLSGYYPVK